MRQRALPLFEEQRTAFALRFTCEDCTYFEPQDEICTHGYPNAEHRLKAREGGQNDLVFCKEFDLV